MKKILIVLVALLVCTVAFAEGWELYGSVIPCGVVTNNTGAENVSKYIVGAEVGVDKSLDNGVSFGINARWYYTSYGNAHSDTDTISLTFYTGKTVYKNEKVNISIYAGAGAGFCFDRTGEGAEFEFPKFEHKNGNGFDIIAGIDTEHYVNENWAFISGISFSAGFGDKVEDSRYIVGGVSLSLGAEYRF